MLRTRLIPVLALILGVFAAGCDALNGGGSSSDTSDFKVTVKNVNMPHPVLKSGAAVSPGGADSGPAIFPGESASFSFDAPPSTLPPLGGSGMHLNLATMFVQSNDLFYAFAPEGLDLYDDDGNAVTGDVTDQLSLYDAGTEVNGEPGVGSDQKPRQSGPNTGADENGTVTRIQDGTQGPGGYTYPDKADVIQVTIEHDGGTQFTVTVKNVSDGMTLQTSEGSKPVPLSPFAWAVHENATGFKLFQTGEPASRGLEWIAEDGFPADMIGSTDLPPGPEALADVLVTKKGLINPLSPPVFAVHDAGFQVFEVGAAASDGIELVAEDGFPAGSLGEMNLPPESGLVEALRGEGAVRMVGARPAPGGKVPALEPAPGRDGESVTYTIHNASPGDRLSLATMFVQSNDLFYGFDEDGLGLFSPNGKPIHGDVTGQVVLYDAGTEVDEEPGVGPTQKPRQGATAVDVGEKEDGVITTVVPAGGPGGGSNDGFSYPATDQFIRVTITPMP